MLNHVVNRFIDRQRWLEPVADVLQKVVAGSYKLLGNPGRSLKTFVHGTWLGHPLHPVLTDIPIGAWTIAILFDLSYLIERSHGWVSAADVTIFIGLLGAIASAVAGYTDWSDTVDRERRVGVAHGLLNTVVILLYLVSFILRVGGGSRVLAILLAYAGYLILLTAAFLGGDLVFGIGTGVNHHAWQEVPTKFTKVLLEGQLTDGMLVKAMAGSRMACSSRPWRATPPSSSTRKATPCAPSVKPALMPAARSRKGSWTATSFSAHGTLHVSTCAPAR